MIKSTAIFLSLMKLILLVGCDMYGHMARKPDFSTEISKYEPFLCTQEYMKHHGNHTCEILIYSSVDIGTIQLLRSLPSPA